MADETPVDVTLVIAPDDAVTHMRAWSSESSTMDAVNDETVSYENKDKPVWVAALGMIAAGVFIGGALLWVNYHSSRQIITASPMITVPITVPVTVPTVTVTAPPSTSATASPTPTISPIPATVSPGSAPVGHTAAENQALLTRLAQLGIDAPDETRAAELIGEANESCVMWQQGKRARQIDQAISLRHDIDLATASLIVSTAQISYHDCYSGAAR